MSLDERILFFRQLKESFIHTGAVTPSSRFLAKAITSEFACHTKPSVILEVGPGTGVFTKEIAKHMISGDQLHICEINAKFAEHIEQMVNTENIFSKLKNQIKIYNAPVQTLTEISHYDYIISGLPLNNFDIPLVNEILSFFKSRLSNGGKLSYFEYIGIRKMKCQLLIGEERKKLHELDKVLCNFVKQYQLKYQIIPFNIPSAYVRHLKF